LTGGGGGEWTGGGGEKTGGGGEWTGGGGEKTGGGGGGEKTGGGGGECTGGGGEKTGGGGEWTGGGGGGEECTSFGVSGLGDGVGFGASPQCLLQSTGRVSSGKHILDDFWSFFPVKQLCESSKATTELGEGTQLRASPLK